MAKLGCYQSWLNLDHQKRSKFEGAPGGPLAKLGALNDLDGPRWSRRVPSKEFKIHEPPFLATNTQLFKT